MSINGSSETPSSFEAPEKSEGALVETPTSPTELVKAAFRKHVKPELIADALAAYGYNTQIRLIAGFVDDPVGALRPISTRFKSEVLLGAPALITAAVKRLQGQTLESVRILEAGGVVGDWSSAQGRLLNLAGELDVKESKIAAYGYNSSTKPPEGIYTDVAIPDDDYPVVAYYIRKYYQIKIPAGDGTFQGFPISQDAYTRAKTDVSETPVAFADAVARLNIGVSLKEESVERLKHVWVQEAADYRLAFDRLGTALLDPYRLNNYYGRIPNQQWESWAREFSNITLNGKIRYYCPGALAALRKIELTLLESFAKSSNRWIDDSTKK